MPSPETWGGHETKPGGHSHQEVAVTARKAPALGDELFQAIHQRNTSKKNRALKRQLSEALEQQTATSEVLGIISSSPGELEAVFEAILATRSDCAAPGLETCGSTIMTCFDQRHARSATSVQRISSPRASDPCGPDNNFGRMLQTRRAVHVKDLRAETKDNLRRESVNLAGMRSLVLVPMIRNRKVIGAVAIYRQEVRPFTEKQIESGVELRRASGDRHREHAAAERVASAHRRSHRIAGATDSDQPRCWASSPVRRASWRRCSRPCWRTRSASAGRITA